MSLHRLPEGWAPDQLDALNELQAARDAWQAAKDAATATNDTSSAAAQVRADLVTVMRAAWARVTSYPT